jgi:ribonuclease T1
MTGRRSWVGLLAAGLLAVLLWWTQGGDPAPAPDTASGLPVVALAELPPQAARTVELIDAGGPYPHDEDDETFFNREELLPDRAEGYYREYTVETPGSPDRGPRRIVAGEGGELYWTDDHYASFSLIDRG